MTDLLHRVDFEPDRNADVVKMLEEALEMARKGEIDAVAITMRSALSPHWFRRSEGNARRFEFMGALQSHVLEIDGWDEDDDRAGD